VINQEARWLSCRSMRLEQDFQLATTVLNCFAIILRSLLLDDMVC